jgi:hypothetical protein
MPHMTRSQATARHDLRSHAHRFGTTPTGIYFLHRPAVHPRTAIQIAGIGSAGPDVAIGAHALSDRDRFLVVAY